ncbi:MAG: hypothetical protein PVH80_00155 [Anaerolineae bacterium]|jgi:hypothetical protein
MSTTTLYRLSALAGFLSGLTIIIGKLLIPLPDPRPGETFDFLSPLFALLLTVGLYLRQRRESGVFGGLAFFVLFIGLSLIVSLAYFGAFMFHELPEQVVDRMMDGPSGPVFIGSILIFVIGELLFGISVIRAGMFSRIAAVLFMITMVPTVLHLAGIFPESVVVISSILAGVALIWWSVELYGLASRQADAV